MVPGDVRAVIINFHDGESKFWSRRSRGLGVLTDYLSRMVSWLRAPGTFFKRIWELIRRKEILYYADLKALNIESGLRLDGISVECYNRLSDVPTEQLSLLRSELLSEFKGKETSMATLGNFFANGGCLWLANRDGKAVSSIWMFSGKLLPYYMGHPILSSDAVLMAGRTFSEFRDRGYFAAMIALICEKLKESGVSRVYCGAHVRNVASQRSQAKVLTRIGTNRHYRFFRWHIAIWEKDS